MHTRILPIPGYQETEHHHVQILILQMVQEAAVKLEPDLILLELNMKGNGC
ncbi:MULTISPECIES: hypothetical protein [Gammaproteobacteria]|uniref:hypothetical protein n=1 Tax=Gammaproteobacteria TaxID=1236 RepID=UPI001AD9705A|nr:MULTISPECIES: hypothetical protein [Gammaproteobacteria]MBO9483949.1 hypothetical protein [Salinisphaera sp. G21_0]MBO9494007.1 hypothetical protein [Thalassotalea sp. G20_0]